MFPRAVLIHLIVGLLVVAVPAGAQVDSDKSPAVELRAEKILRAALDYLESAKEFTFHVEETMDQVMPKGQKVQCGGFLDMSVRRPDRLRYRHSGDLHQTDAWYDGKNFTLMDRTNNTYTVFPAPETLDALVDNLKQKQGFRLPLFNLLRDGLTVKALEDVRSGFYAGFHRVGGIPCHHLAFSQDNMDWQVWVEDGAQPLLRKMVISFNKLPGSPQYAAEFSQWDFAPHLGGLLFSFDPPEGAVKADFLSLPKK